MNFIWTVKVERSQSAYDHYTLTVAASTPLIAITKAVREAKRKSGFRAWQCVALERGGRLIY
jgi:hypothetical protein